MSENDVRRGIKQVEQDKILYNIKVFFSLVVGVIAGVATNSFLVGVIVTTVLGVMSANRYFEGGRRK
jgi:hypothetical protein